MSLHLKESFLMKCDNLEETACVRYQILIKSSGVPRGVMTYYVQTASCPDCPPLVKQHAIHCFSGLLFPHHCHMLRTGLASKLADLWQPIIAKHLLHYYTFPNTFSCKLRCTCCMSLTSLKSRLFRML